MQRSLGNIHTVRAKLLTDLTRITWIARQFGDETFYQFDFESEEGGALSQFIQSQGYELRMMGALDSLLNVETAVKLIDRFCKEKGFRDKYFRGKFIYKNLDAFITGTHVSHFFLCGVLVVQCNTLDAQLLQPLLDTGIAKYKEEIGFSIALNTLMENYSIEEFEKLMDKMIGHYSRNKLELFKNHPQFFSKLEEKLVNAIRNSNVFMLSHIHILQGFCDGPLVSPEHHKKTLMYYAAQECKSTNVLNYLSQEGLSISEPLTEGPYAGITPLFAAAEAGNMVAVHYFVNRGILIADSLKFGAYENMAPLDIAVIKDHSHIVTALVTAGVSPERLNFETIRKKLHAKETLKVLRADEQILFRHAQSMRDLFGITNINDVTWTSDSGYTILRLNNNNPELYILRQFLVAAKIQNMFGEDRLFYCISRYNAVRILDMFAIKEEWQTWLKFKNTFAELLGEIKALVRPVFESVLSEKQILDIPGGFIIEPNLGEAFALRDFLMTVKARVMSTMPGAICIELTGGVEAYSELTCLQATQEIVKLSLYLNALKHYMRHNGASRKVKYNEDSVEFQLKDNIVSYTREQILALDLDAIRVQQQEVVEQPVAIVEEDKHEEKVELLDKIICAVKVGKTGKKRFVDGGIIFAFRDRELKKTIYKILGGLLVEQDEAGQYLLSYYQLCKYSLAAVQGLHDLCLERIKALTEVATKKQEPEQVKRVATVVKIKVKDNKKGKKKKQVKAKKEEVKVSSAEKPKKDWSYWPKQKDRDFDLLGLRHCEKRSDGAIQSIVCPAAESEAGLLRRAPAAPLLAMTAKHATLIELPPNHNAFEGCIHTEIKNLQADFKYIEFLMQNRTYSGCESIITNASIWLSMVRVFNAIYENHGLGLHQNNLIRIDCNSDIIAGDIRKDLLAAFFVFGNVSRFYDELMEKGFISAVNQFLQHKPAKHTVDLSLARLSLFAVQEMKPANNAADILLVLERLKEICDYQSGNEACPKLQAMEAHLVALGDLIADIKEKPDNLSEDLFSYLKKVCRKMRNVATHNAVHASENGYSAIPKIMVIKMATRVTSKRML